MFDFFGGELTGIVDSSFFFSGNCYEVHLATLLYKCGFKHDVCVDARKAPVVVYDCNETFAINLSVRVLQACMGEYPSLITS